MKNGHFGPKAWIQLGRMLTLISASYLCTPISLVFYLLGYRFFSVDLKQIGSILWLDSYIREDQLGSRATPAYKIFVTRSHFTDANPYSLDLYNEYFTFIFNPFLKLVLAPFFMNPIFATKATKFEQLTDASVSEDTRWSLAQENHRKYVEKFGHHVVNLPDSEVNRAKVKLSSILPPDAKFVVLHVRDAGFYNDARRQTRGADIGTYEKAIKYLIDEGYYIVRIGHSSADSIVEMQERVGSQLVDYAWSSIRSDFLDCYLTSKCAFYIGCSSGPSALPDVFGVPTCNVNVYTAATATLFLEQNLATFKKIIDKESKALIPFKQLVTQPFDRNLQASELEKNGAELVNNTPDEILDTVKEFVNRKNYSPSPLQLWAKSQLKPYNYSYGSCGCFSNTILKLYSEEHKTAKAIR